MRRIHHHQRKRKRRPKAGFEPIAMILPKALAALTRQRRRAERWTQSPFTLARSCRLDQLLEAERAGSNVIKDRERE